MAEPLSREEREPQRMGSDCDCYACRYEATVQRAEAVLREIAMPHGHADPHRTCCEIARRVEDRARAYFEEADK